MYLQPKLYNNRLKWSFFIYLVAIVCMIFIPYRIVSIFILIIVSLNATNYRICLLIISTFIICIIYYRVRMDLNFKEFLGLYNNDYYDIDRFIIDNTMFFILKINEKPENKKPSSENDFINLYKTIFYQENMKLEKTIKIHFSMDNIDWRTCKGDKGLLYDIKYLNKSCRNKSKLYMKQIFAPFKNKNMKLCNYFCFIYIYAIIEENVMTGLNGFELRRFVIKEFLKLLNPIIVHKMDLFIYSKLNSKFIKH